jgi:hypothetical protein
VHPLWMQSHRGNKDPPRLEILTGGNEMLLGIPAWGKDHKGLAVEEPLQMLALSALDWKAG